MLLVTLALVYSICVSGSLCDELENKEGQFTLEDVNQPEKNFVEADNQKKLSEEYFTEDEQRELAVRNAEVSEVDDQIEKVSNTLKGMVDLLTTKVDQFSMKVDTMEKKISEREVKSRVFFTACATTKQGAPEAPLKFEKVLTNIGGHYNSQNSSFVCPYHGIYEFELTVLANVGYRIAARIVKTSASGENVKMIACFAGRISDKKGVTQKYNQASNSVLLECMANDVIWVIYVYSEKDGMYGDNDNACYSSFSGKLVALL